MNKETAWKLCRYVRSAHGTIIAVTTGPEEENWKELRTNTGLLIHISGDHTFKSAKKGSRIVLVRHIDAPPSFLMTIDDPLYATPHFACGWINGFDVYDWGPLHFMETVKSVEPGKRPGVAKQITLENRFEFWLPTTSGVGIGYDIEAGYKILVDFNPPQPYQGAQVSYWSTDGKFCHDFGLAPEYWGPPPLPPKQK